MRFFGCFGCLTLIAILSIIMIFVVASYFLSSHLFYVPDTWKVETSSEDGYRCQQKIAEILLRQAGLSIRKEKIQITEREINSFLIRHFDTQKLVALKPIIVRFNPNQISVEGKASLKILLADFPFSDYERISSFLNKPIWITLKGNFEQRKERFQIKIQEFYIGKQYIPIWLFYYISGEDMKDILNWRLPEIIEDIQVEKGRIIIATKRRERRI